MKAKMTLKRLLTAVLVVLLCAVGAGYLYVSDYYRADELAIEALSGSGTVSVYETGDGMTVFAPEQAETGFIFYPGGKVEYTAYAPLLRGLAEEGIICVAVKMPLNLAVLDVNAADGVREQFASVETWYIGGHSLGGSMAASHAAEHTEEYEGLILLAAYSTADLRKSGLEVLSLYGSADGVLNMEKYGQYRSNLPADTMEAVIQGGNHAQFGSYGPQDGDGAASVSAEEQLAQTISAISDLILKKS